MCVHDEGYVITFLPFYHHHLHTHTHTPSQQVHLISRHQDQLTTVASSLHAPGGPGLEGTVSFNDVDVTDTPALEKAIKGMGKLQGLAYCVGSINLKPLKATTTEDFIQAFLLNTVGAATAIRAALPGMMANYKQTGTAGSVVLFSSVAVQQGFPNHAIIGAVKGGIEGLTRSLAAELAPAIRVNAIAPSLTDTPLASILTRSPTMKEAIAKSHPIPRLGTGDDVAAAASFLLDPSESSWVTGQVVGIDGGRSVVRR